MARAAAAYYGQGAGIGADFTTAPEMSQAFGECLGLWSAVTWAAMGRPARVVWAEAGPGRGTLMQDALRAARQMAPDFAQAAEIHLVETSPVLRAMQKGRLGAAVAAWHDRLEELPPGPTLLLANEFLDALPIRQLVRRADGWQERWVQDGAFVERPSPLDPGPAPEGEVRELGEAAQAVAAWCAARVTRHGGAALFLDYGPARSAPGDSLQAMLAGRPASPLAPPGSVDLSAHVDFAALARAAAGARVHGPIPQGVFLARLGLNARSALLARAAPSHARAILSAAQRLLLPESMGRLFKAICLAHPALPIPEGFRD
ncbi:class I SAM-dependent methyltransferase [Roseococcus sp. DSY-14]|uniref:class I SAM-dependent methyltransferase n=1 Tax=Roseococcus sp. DSY-14 TaxID=3369650 RepID=UPI00387B4645